MPTRKGFIQNDSNATTFWKKRNHRDSTKVNGASGRRAGLVEMGRNRVLRAVEMLRARARCWGRSLTRLLVQPTAHITPRLNTNVSYGFCVFYEMSI